MCLQLQHHTNSHHRRRNSGSKIFEQQVNRIILVAVCVGQNWKKMILSLKFSATAAVVVVVVEDTTHYISS